MRRDHETLRRTQGRLSLAERAGLLVDAARADMAARKNTATARTNAKMLESVRAPESALAREAVRVVTGVAPAWIVEHSQRAWMFGVLLARSSDIAFDVDVLFAAAMLHDLGLTPTYAQPVGVCFALRSADAAYDLARVNGADESAARAIADAIALHMELRVALADGVESHLLNAGLGIDVVGARAREIDDVTRAAVVARHPRDNMKRNLCDAFASEARRSPRTRIALYVKLGFAVRIRSAPFDE